MPAALYRFAIVAIWCSSQRPRIFRERLFVRAVRHSCGSQDKLIHNFGESFVRNIAYKCLQDDVRAVRIPPNRSGHNINPNWVSVCRFFAIQDLHHGWDRLVGGVTGQALSVYSGAVAQDATDGDLLLRSELVIGNFPRAQLVVHVFVQA